MVSSSNNEYKITPYLSDEDSFLKFNEIIKICFKNTKIIVLLSFTGFIFSFFYAFNKQNIYGGGFQILVNKNEDTSSKKEVSFSSFFSPNIANNQIATEIEILKSPSVLRPVFEFVKENKRLKGIKVEKMRYSNWLKNNMEVFLVNGTNVLDLTYKDSDKDTIMPTLEMISKTYQEYSGRNRTESLNKGLNYLNNQITKYQKLSTNAMQKSSIHAKDNDLIPIAAALSLNQDFQGLSQNNLEVLRIEAANEIKTLETQIFEIESKPTDYKLEPYLYKNKLDDLSLINKITELEIEIFRMQSIYRAKDLNLISRIEQKNNLELLLKDKVLKSLKNELELAKAKLKASERPIDVLTKYDELIKETSLNYNTLEQLKNDKIKLELQIAKNQDPWEIITNPTVLDRPIAPNKKNIVFTGSLLSIFLIISIITLINKIKGVLYLSEDIEKILGLETIQEFSIKNFESAKENMNLLSKNTDLIKENSSLAFLTIGNINIDVVEQFRSVLESSLSFKKILFTKNLMEARKMDMQFIIIKKGEITKNELLELKQKLTLQNHLTSGLFLLTD